ncbi:MAG TPA: hypothetical protein DCS07_06645 [Bdellovibrionales bacterium]|nr:MAG: hypothetical protein A2Z97_09180 [Bdellovibrionales bacterium GWB1_52_6]OFZ05412.1 MAG: hypothetical protein A2X97_11060 [Bdellovibrionales bacterium GWA1_52_35]OFZ32799.1 MAG: hypothetical protein A2070_12325 [Bdellovibrionales bacterium GWC1_52_8]HAR42296.1 hypothetical protein [Bdellovibrionales bacterium]HCM39228.1 hypothetical protein [Bdellovibrionales bacterium]
MIYLVWVAIFFVSQPLAFAEPGCLEDAPLIQRTVSPTSETCTESTETWNWRLPISWNYPEVITAAQVQLELRKYEPAGNWFAVLHFSFPDPLPLGIPFTFQKAKLRWSDQEVEIDWSSACQNVGRGMFPGQHFEERIELPQTESFCSFDDLTFKIWGGRY